MLFGFYFWSRAENLNSQKEKIENEAKNNPYGISQEDVEWMRNATILQLKGCRVKGAGDVWIYTPDGVGNYKALWTRDFYYMVEYAGDLMIWRTSKLPFII